MEGHYKKKHKIALEGGMRQSECEKSVLEDKVRPR